MSLKAKLVTSISAFALVLALLIVGVLAASSVTVNMGGQISFTASDVHARVTINVEGTAAHDTTDDATYLFTYDADEEANGATLVTGNSADWTSKSWTFDDARTITVTVKIENLDASRSIDVTFVAPEDNDTTVIGANLTCATTSTGTNVASATIAGSGDLTYTMTFTITDQNASVSNAAWGAVLTLANAA